MSVKERDPLTGHQTTGHEWNGITELNTRVPRAVWAFIIVTHVWAVIYWVLMPAWPGINDYTRGLLGIDQKDRVERQVVAADAARGVWTDRIAALDLEQIRDESMLMAHVDRTAPALFGDNCAACHGARAEGGPGYPSLTDGAWIWGGADDTILETLRVGVNSPHPETRFAQMLAFGRDGILSRDEVRILADYVQSLAGLDSGAGPARLDAGAALFSDNCTSCHGEDGTGTPELGAPNLTDDAWIYGSSDAALFKTIHDGRQGWMPAWEDRLTLAQRKMLALYITGLADAEGGPDGD
ncbi:cytochrome-c oxidase, cbb3-type subunit III [Mesobaculum littorinae]|uniref:Cbb3-type cytochrome c oxidase subunit n=1 Tax=Mesobaculum littorinae TaxID=2486419 RepID=A0A438ADE4_9RHOB|nr:cytochrome-c oxidase, cbb3-type subunit III [Mesobaculum littorinae]RVV96713.1 cytochrome-c oxidase, cbb3-type subunit III [Mesobaculum littorinae]